MTTAYSTNLGLALPVEGELAGTWGDTVNNGITDYLDIAVAGTLTLNGDGAVTLTDTNGDSSSTNIGATTAQYAVLNITGTLTTTKVITAPSHSKTYVIVNAATGGSVTVKASGQTGVTVGAGEKALVAFNGTDYVQVAGSATDGVSTISFGSTGLTPSTATSGAVTVAGTLGVANGGTGATTLTANNVLLGNGTSAVQAVAPSTTGNVLTSNGTTWVSSAPAPGGIDYVVKTGNYTTQNNEGVLANTSGGAFTVTLPATPSTGDQCVVADATGDWGTNNLTVGRNGSTIAGSASDLVCDIGGVSVQLIYNGTTWDVYAQVGGNGGTAVTLTGVQTLTNKTITNLINDGSITEEVYALGTSGSLALEPDNGTIQTCALTGDPTFTDALSSGQSIVLMLTNGASYTVTWPTITWATSSGDTAPTLTAADTLVFWKISSTLYGAYVGSYA